MPDRNKDVLRERNKRTLLVVRTPDGFPQRVEDEAKKRGMTVSAFVVEQITPALPEEPEGN